MQQITTAFSHLPLSYQCAIETLGASGDRNQERLQELCGFFAAGRALIDPMHKQWVHDAWCIAKRRYWLD